MNEHITGGVIGVCHFVLVVSAVTVPVGLMTSPAVAQVRSPTVAWALTGPSPGSGKRNNNTFGNNSPTKNVGYQHSSNSNAGGQNSVQNVVCRNARSCRILQRANFPRFETFLEIDPVTGLIRIGD